MKKLLIILLLLACIPAQAETNKYLIIIADTNRMNQVQQNKLFGFLGEQVAPAHLSDPFHGIKEVGRIFGGRWLLYTNLTADAKSVIIFNIKLELEKKTYTKQYTPDGLSLTNVITHGRTIDDARLTKIQGLLNSNQLKLIRTNAVAKQLEHEKIFAVKPEDL